MARRRRGLKFPAWALAAALFALSAALAVWVWGPVGRGPAVEAPSPEQPVEAVADNPATFADSLAASSQRLLAGLGAPAKGIRAKRLPSGRGGEMRWEVRADIPGDLPLALCNLELTRLATRLGGEVLEATQSREGDRLSMLMGMDGRPTGLVTLKRVATLKRALGRVAIIIDDVGYQDRTLIEGFCRLGQRITLSVFPSEKQTRFAADQALANGKGVMVHLPMEPRDYPFQDPGPDAIFAGYPEERIRSLTAKALAEVPHARGMNNHMGSKVTEERAAISAVLKETAQQGFFFVDSGTSPKSVAYDAAREMGLACGRAILYLDQVETPEAIEAAFDRLLQEARMQGTVIAIGHAKPLTLKVLQRKLMEAGGGDIQFVTAEEAVR